MLGMFVRRSVCMCQRATLTVARTDTRGCLRVHGKPGLATPAHGRAVTGAGGARFGITVRACALICCCCTKDIGVYLPQIR